jgi:hypothetical protein
MEDGIMSLVGLLMALLGCSIVGAWVALSRPAVSRPKPPSDPVRPPARISRRGFGLHLVRARRRPVRRWSRFAYVGMWSPWARRTGER